MEASTIHQADGGREEEWAESQQGSGVVGSRNLMYQRICQDPLKLIIRKFNNGGVGAWE